MLTLLKRLAGPKRLYEGGGTPSRDMSEGRFNKMESAGSIRAEVLRKAEAAICGQRELDYGSPENNLGTIARLWSEYLDTEVYPLDVAMMMCLLKVARIKNGGGTGDSFVDLCGYGAIGGEIFSHRKGQGQL